MSAGLMEEVEEEVAGMVVVPVTVTPWRIDDIIAGDSVEGSRFVNIL